MFSIDEIKSKIWLYNASVFNLLVGFMFITYMTGFWDIELGPAMTMVFFFEVSIVLISGPFLVAQWKDARQKLKTKETRHYIDLLYWGLLAMTMFAIGIHSGANQISLVESSPNIELYDEHLGHFIGVVSTTLAFLATFVIYLRHPVQKNISDKEFNYLAISAAFQTFFLVPAMIEAQSAVLFMIAAVAVIFLSLISVPMRKIYHYPMVIYYLFIATLAIIGITAWYVVAGGFVQPSELWEFIGG